MSAAIEETVLPSHFDATLRANTRLRSPALCPEIPLHLLRRDTPVRAARAQATSQPFPYWGVAWGSGQALARWIPDHPQVVSGRCVADLISQLQESAGPGQIVLLSKPGRRGAILYDVDLLGTDEVRAEPETEAFFVQQASEFQLRPCAGREHVE